MEGIFGEILAMAKVVPQSRECLWEQKEKNQDEKVGTWVTRRGSWALGEVSGCRGVPGFLEWCQGMEGSWDV